MKKINNNKKSLRLYKIFKLKIIIYNNKINFYKNQHNNNKVNLLISFQSNKELIKKGIKYLYQTKFKIINRLKKIFIFKLMI